MLFILLVALSALFVAGCSAFFSIKGLVVLFSGSAIAIGIMGSSLEIGKLVAASFLHTQWKKTSFALKAYLSLAVFVLMCITSLGIFGFLTGAYQEHSTKVNTFDNRISALEIEKKATDQSVADATARIHALTEIRATQEERVQAAGNYKAPRDQAYKAIAEANEEIQKKEAAISGAREKSVELEKQISELKITLDTTTDIGSFKFLAAAINKDVDTAVRYFIFALIFVFDPLAVALVLAWNKLLEQRAEKKKEDEHVYLRSFAATKEHIHSCEISPEPSLEHKEHSAPIVYTKTIKPVEAVHQVVEIAQPEESTAPVKEEVEVVQEQLQDIDIPVDAVSKMVVGHVEYYPELEHDPDFLALSEDQKAEIRKGRTKKAGDNNSVITS